MRLRDKLAQDVGILKGLAAACIFAALLWAGGAALKLAESIPDCARAAEIEARVLARADMAFREGHALLQQDDQSGAFSHFARAEALLAALGNQYSPEVERKLGLLLRDAPGYAPERRREGELYLCNAAEAGDQIAASLLNDTECRGGQVLHY